MLQIHRAQIRRMQQRETLGKGGRRILCLNIMSYISFFFYKQEDVMDVFCLSVYIVLQT